MQDVVSGQEAISVGRRLARVERGRSRLQLLTVRQVVLPVLLAAAVLAGLIALRLVVFGGNATGFVDFGQRLVQHTRPPQGAWIRSRWGNDGQFFYLQAKDPLLLHDSTIRAMRAAGAGFRSQRMGYPLLAFLVAGGSTGALPVALLTVNVLVLLALVAGFAVYARKRGWPTGWAVALALMPGMLLPVLKDLSDPLATACLLAGVLLAQSGKRWSAAAALTLAVLTREVTILVVVALGLELGLRAWKSRQRKGGWRAVIRTGLPAVMIPLLAFCAWQAYITVRFGGVLGTAAADVPGLNLIQELRTSFDVAPIFTYAAWDAIYIVLIVVGIIAAVASLRRGITPVRVAACGVAIGILLPALADPWSDTRVSAPLFALLLMDGLHRRSRPILLLCAGVTCMTLLAPISLPGMLWG